MTQETSIYYLPYIGYDVSGTLAPRRHWRLDLLVRLPGSQRHEAGEDHGAMAAAGAGEKRFVGRNAEENLGKATRIIWKWRKKSL